MPTALTILQTPSVLLLLLLLLIFHLPPTVTSSSVSETDLLLAFKSSLQDPSSSLSDWSPATPTCEWRGITCSSPVSSNSSVGVTSLDLQNLNLSGEISASLCQLPHLTHLNLAQNLFNQPIPLHFSQCSSLQTLNLSSNLLWGTIPSQISQLSSLKVLDLGSNRIEGRVLESLGSLQGLQVLNLGANMLTGTLPPSAFGNKSGLVYLDLSQNPLLASELPPEIGKMGNLQKLFLQGSGFQGGIPESFLGLHELEILDLSQNNLSGRVPLGFGLGLTKLASLDLSENRLSGSFPIDACYGKVLREVKVHTNSLTGLVPGSFDKCSSLEVFQVQNNAFSGDFPSGIWSLPNLLVLRAENNQFTGEVPNSVASATRLEQVQIDNNSFTGRIPQGLGLIKTLYRFSASFNSFYGDLPENFCDSPLMSIINLSHNALSGSIPQFRNCKKLVSLSLAANSFTGRIPASLAQLPVLTYIDLSNNSLTGEIPEGLQNLKLALFNVSFNRLSGNVPPSLISGLPASFLQGNPGLCGPGLPNSCSDGKPSRRGSRITGIVVFVLVALASVVAIMLLLSGFLTKYRTSQSGSLISVFFYSLRITEQDLMAGMNEKTAVGKGAFGSVHIIQLPGGEFVAVKKMINSGSFSFRTMKGVIRVLAKARHKNITKLLGFVYSDDSILLIYEFLPRGSLGDVICQKDLCLEWNIRLRIALGAAQGLSYLHKEYIPHMLHRNVKSTNILLDADYEPKITDFGLDRVVSESTYRSSMASQLGVCCYIAPEHGYTKKATEQMDVYSFGVVLLELITGRPAEQPESRDSLDVVKWVRRKINTTSGALEILDPRISGSSQQEMLKALELALNCTSVVPEKRPTMAEVAQSLQSIGSLGQPARVFACEASTS